MDHPYFPLVIVFALAGVVVLALLFIAQKVGPKSTNPAKMEPFESGNPPKGDAVLSRFGERAVGDAGGVEVGEALHVEACAGGEVGARLEVEGGAGADLEAAEEGIRATATTTTSSAPPTSPAASRSARTS